jgi:hypothetical protein
MFAQSQRIGPRGFNDATQLDGPDYSPGHTEELNSRLLPEQS